MNLSRNIKSENLIKPHLIYINFINHTLLIKCQLQTIFIINLGNH